MISLSLSLSLSLLSKAFDCLNHDLLIAKLGAYGFSHDALKFIRSYLKERKQRTKVGSDYSRSLEIKFGVRQGSIEMKPNADKSHLLVLNNQVQASVKLGEEIIASSPSVDLLGVKIDENLNFAGHITKLCKKGKSEATCTGKNIQIS